VRLARFALLIASLAFGVAGLSFLIAPAFLTSRVGISLADATADNDIRAVYGGLELGLALFFLVSQARPAWLRPALVAAVLTLSGMAAARVVSWLVVGLPEPVGYVLHAPEVFGAVLGLVALLRLPEDERAAA